MADRLDQDYGFARGPKEQKGEGAEDVCKGMMMMGLEPRLAEEGNVARWAV